ncbi:hypothetical protein DFH06DRAFT_157258 [Mycena polygramma]|nr:hypothetical protein DFH06DRAFT_157258 [Mycena polygramma]
MSIKPRCITPLASTTTMYPHFSSPVPRPSTATEPAPPLTSAPEWPRARRNQEIHDPHILPCAWTYLHTLPGRRRVTHIPRPASSMLHDTYVKGCLVCDADDARLGAIQMYRAFTHAHVSRASLPRVRTLGGRYTVSASTVASSSPQGRRARFPRAGRAAAVSGTILPPLTSFTPAAYASRRTRPHQRKLAQRRASGAMGIPLPLERNCLIPPIRRGARSPHLPRPHRRPRPGYIAPPLSQRTQEVCDLRVYPMCRASRQHYTPLHDRRLDPLARHPTASAHTHETRDGPLPPARDNTEEGRPRTHRRWWAIARDLPCRWLSRYGEA